MPRTEDGTPRSPSKISGGNFTFCWTSVIIVIVLEWVAIPFSKGSSQSRNQTRVSCIAGRFFTSWILYFPTSCQGSSINAKQLAYHRFNSFSYSSIHSFVQAINICCVFFMDSTKLRSVSQFSRSVMSNSLQPHKLQHARPPCPSPTPITNSRGPPRPMSIESMMPSNHLILCCPLLLLPSIFPSIRAFSNESALCISWPKYWSFSFNISPSDDVEAKVRVT